ncbi:hypothetical protein, partial [Priestia megaterium]|uniref:hypothetical protein n=1 Tax=Priestia megaterium TaxID=1404 RepID=UPI001C994EC8
KMGKMINAGGEKMWNKRNKGVCCEREWKGLMIGRNGINKGVGRMGGIMGTKILERMGGKGGNGLMFLLICCW